MVLKNYFKEFLESYTLSEDDKDEVQLDQEKKIYVDPDVEDDEEKIKSDLEDKGIPVASKNLVGKIEDAGEELYLFEPEESEKERLKDIFKADMEWVDSHIFYATDGKKGFYVFIDPDAEAYIPFEEKDLEGLEDPMQDLYDAIGAKGNEYNKLIFVDKSFVDRFISSKINNSI